MTIFNYHYRLFLSYHHRLSFCIFHYLGISPGKHTLKVLVEDQSYGTTTLDVQNDIDKFITMLHKTVQTDAIRLLSKLLGTPSEEKEDVGSDLVDYLSEKSFNQTFLKLLENMLRLEPEDGKPLRRIDSLLQFPHILDGRKLFFCVCVISIFLFIMKTYLLILTPLNPTFIY